MSDDCTREGEFHMHSDRCYEAGRREVIKRLADEDVRETVAESISIATGDMTTYSDDAHPDHNRWSWRGDGHGDVIREMYRTAADAALTAVRGALDGA